MKPEELARQQIDEMLAASGWVVQDRNKLNQSAGEGIAIREFSLKTGFADYFLLVNRKAVGVIEAKPAGHSLGGVREQSVKYLSGVDPDLPVARLPLPFHYETTGTETYFTSLLDPIARSRQVFSFHRPATLWEWLAKAPEDGPNMTLRARLRTLPPLPTLGLRDCQIEAITNLEQSLAKNHPRALIQMATGSGKTYTAVNFTYRLIKFGGAKRVLFLVDRGNLGRQTLNEFQQFSTPDDGRKFTELYNVQHLQGPIIDPVARVCVTTIQRLYSLLSGTKMPDDEVDERSLFEEEEEEQVPIEPKGVRYNPELPIETFDVIVTDECHRSIYNRWRGVLEYFDASLIGLTATPNKQTFGFFQQNLVMEYGHVRAVADGVNVDYLVYTIRTQITQKGSTVEKGYYIDKRDRRTREVRWEEVGTDLTYAPGQLDRDVVALDQIRTVLRTFKDALFTELFPERRASGDVPKTLIFAKDDTHADDIVRIVMEVFDEGNEFVQKITYKTTGRKPEELIAEFRNSYSPRIAVTVDMIATGTDIKSLEILLFMRAVKSAIFFEQMKGRGTRVVTDDEFHSVTPEGSKTHFVLVDAVGVYESSKTDEPPLDREPSVPLKHLLNDVALNKWERNANLLPTLVSRLGRLNQRLAKRPADAAAIRQASGGKDLHTLVLDLVRALSPDEHLAAAQAATGQQEPAAQARKAAALQLTSVALAPFDNPVLREALLKAQAHDEQIIDTVSKDSVLSAGWDPQARERARQSVSSFRAFIETHKDEITALQMLLNTPRRASLIEADLKQLAEAIAAPPLGLTTDRLWQAYETLKPENVRNGTKRLLVDLVSLIRYTMVYDTDETATLEPYRTTVERRFAAWLTEQEERRHAPFSAEQRTWLELMRDTIASSLTIEPDDFAYQPFNQHGGLGKASQLFGSELSTILQELNERLAA